MEHADRAWVVGLPKAEVHVHLEGCVPLEVVGPTDTASGSTAIGSLSQLLSHLDQLCRRVQRADQLATIASQLSGRARDGGVRHVDVIMNPSHWPSWRGRLGEMIEALDAPWHREDAAGGPSVGLCVSLSRTQSEAEALARVEEVIALDHRRVVGLSLDGNEAHGSHNERFARAFARAAEAGLHRCVHAGESGGPDGVREAVELLGAERIDHGIRCVEDPDLVRDLAQHGIPLDVCPSSNVALGVVANLASHPIERLRRAGVAVSVNTDDPLLYGIDLVGEYQRCADAFGWGRSELGEVARTSVMSSFAPPERRRAILAELDRYLSW